MLPALFAVAGMSGLQSILGGLQNRKQIAAQNAANAAANYRNTIEAFQGVSAIEVQRARLRQQTAKTLDLAGRRAEEEASTTGAMAAAVGVKGASVDAVQDAIARERQDAEFEVASQYSSQDYDLNQRIRELVTGTRLNFAQMQKVPSIGSVIGGGLLSGALSAGTMYAASYFRFGSGGPNLQGQSTALTNNTAFVKRM